MPAGSQGNGSRTVRIYVAQRSGRAVYKLRAGL